VNDIEITRLGWARHILGMGDERIHLEKKRFTMRNSPTQDQSEKQNKQTNKKKKKKEEVVQSDALQFL
jgi:hypothetical protein